MSVLEKFSKRKKAEDVDQLIKKGKLEDLEVTGVSRSGRVRKKSSKLTDFESPDDLDHRFKRGVKISTPGRTSDEYDVNVKAEHANVECDDPVSEAESEGHYDSNIENESAVSTESDGHSDAEEGTDENQDAGPSQSVYLFEKSKKKVVLMKDGRLILKAKAQRKDKGKSRFTAYMLWAKGVRNDLNRSNPELDFSAISKKLGELWATVPNNEKYNWRRRAKRLALRIAKGNEEKAAKATAATQFINKTKGKSSVKIKSLQTEDTANTQASSHEVLSPRYNSGMYKVTGIQPLDVAAHLKVLGESLSIIGERLKDHEGQIAVSGSLSVLLDSLLCSIGPLMCLTQQLPLVNNYNPDGLQELLDNIAYVMPGL